MQDNREVSGDLALALVCTNYIQGFMDAGTLSTSFCTGEATIATVIRVYVAYLDKNPKLLDGMRGTGVLLSLTDAYPCFAK